MSLLALGMLSGNLAQAGNIIQNPGFETDAGYGYFGSGTIPTMPGNWQWDSPGNGGWWMQSFSASGDNNPRSGNNFFKEWGAYQGNITTNNFYQDNACGAGATYTCDFWQGSTSDAFGNPDRFCWGQVSFYDGSGNLLALYSAQNYDSSYVGSFTNTAGKINWFPFFVTNQCDVVSGAVTGSVSVLTAPAGAHTIRFTWGNWQSAAYDGGDFALDDVNLNQIGGPVAPLIAQVYPGNMLFASNQISFHVTSATSTPINTGDIHLTVNGVDVSGSCSFSGSSPDISVIYTGVPNNAWANTASLTAKDSLGLSAPPISFAFDTIHPAFVWEVEDYDYTNAVSGGGGLYINNPTPTSTPIAGSYFGLQGDNGIDYFTSSGPYSTAFRPLDTRNINVTGDYARQQYIDAQVSDPAARDWEIDNINNGDWGNYTRDYPAGTFNVYARVSGNAGTLTALNLDSVSGGATNSVGVFSFTGMGWGVWQYVPLIDNYGNLLPLTFGGVQTLRVTLSPVGGLNENFFMLVPAVTGQPFLTNISPTNGAVFAPAASGFSFTATATDGTTINNSGIHLNLNGADVTSSLNFSGSGPINVSYASLQPNTLYTAVITVTNTLGAGVSRTITFDTMNPANFYVKMEDFDYNGGAYDTNGNGLTPNAYIGDGLPNDLGAVSNVDYFHQTSDGGSYPYRGPNALATELTSDIPLPGYTVGFDYDVGNFNGGNFGNYTRNYPAGKYMIYGRLAGYNQNTALAQVTSGLGTTSQTLQALGTWQANPGGWSTWTWVPLQNNGTPVILTLGGVETLRVTSAGNCNANYFMLVPATGITLSATRSGSNVQISFPTQMGGSYRVWSNTTLTGGTWSLVATVPGNGVVQAVSDPMTGSQMFYKVTSP